MVLRSDSKRFSEEFEAAEKDSKRNVIKRYRALVRERNKVGGYFIPCNSVDSSISQFGDVMSELERAAEQSKVNARADVQKRRIERCGVDIYPPSNPLILSRIWEKLSEEGWGEEIATRKPMYEPGLMKIKGVMMFRPLGEKGVCVPDPRLLMT